MSVFDWIISLLLLKNDVDGFYLLIILFFIKFKIEDLKYYEIDFCLNVVEIIL